MVRVGGPGSPATAARLQHASELFTDRASEANAFRAALSAFRRHLDSDEEAGVARSNVLTFCGMGGIGKTALSQRFEDWINRKLPPENDWGTAPTTRVAATGRIDLHESAGQMDVLAALLALRAAVAVLKPRWPVFDLAFAAYWSSVRPGDPLPSFRGSKQLSTAVLETVGDALSDVGSLADLAGAGVGSGLAIRGVRKLISEVRRRRDLRLGIEAYPGFEQFLLRCVDEPSPTEAQPSLACEIGGTLAWELAQISPTPLVIVFVDTAERLALDRRRTSEGHLNQLIYELPNVLFVVTGRDMLDWWDQARTELIHRGRWTWPGLTPEASAEPHQHLLEPLSREDTITVILRGRRQLTLPIPDGVVQELARASSGLPQYLELARQVAISINDAGDGRQVTIADVTGSLGSLVRRVLDDVPADEQRAIRAASLFRTFDSDLVAAAAGVDHGCAERAVARPMIDRHDGERFPYRMHDAVREALRKADHHGSGGWSDRDWELASTRAAAAAHRLHDDAKRAEDNGGVLDAVGIAIGLACEQPTELEPSASTAYADWLTRAIVYCPSVQGLRSRVPSSSKTAYGRYVLAFIDAKSQDVEIDERLHLLRSLFDSEHPLRMPAGRHLCYALRGQYRWDEALAVCDELVMLDPTSVNVNQRPETLSMARRFADARDAVASAPSAAARIARASDYAHGLPERYFQEIGAGLDWLRAEGRQREYMEEQATLLVRRAIFHGDLNAGEVRDFLSQSELAGHSMGTKVGLQAAILDRQNTPDVRLIMLEQLRAMDRAVRNGRLGSYFAMAELCDALIAGDQQRLLQLSGEVAAAGDRSRAWIPVEGFLAAIGLPPPPISTTQWLDPYPIVMNRWAAHLGRYLARHDAPSLA